jgi:hypothetical protein
VEGADCVGVVRGGGVFFLGKGWHSDQPDKDKQCVDFHDLLSLGVFDALSPNDLLRDSRQVEGNNSTGV